MKRTNYRIYYKVTFNRHIRYKDIKNYGGNLSQVEARVRKMVNKQFAFDVFKSCAIHELFSDYRGTKLLKRN